MDGGLWELGGEDSPSVRPRRLLVGDWEADLEGFFNPVPRPFGVYAFGDHIGFPVGEVAARLGLRVFRSIRRIDSGRSARQTSPHAGTRRSPP